MSEEDPAPSARPWRDGLAAGVGATLLAALIVALIDASAAGFGTLPVVLGLWAPLALGLGLVIGVVVAGFRASFGDRALGAALRRLSNERERDLAVTGAVLAAGLIAIFMIVFIGAAAKALVVNVQRQATGAGLLGVVVVAALPLIATLAFPLYRATRWVAWLVPRIRPIPRVVVLVVVGTVLIVLAGLVKVFTQLDWQVLGLGFYGLVAGMFALSLGFLALARGPLDGLRRRIPARGPIVIAAALIAAVLPVLTLGGTPSRDTKTAILDHSLAGSRLVALYSKYFD
jgi:hypothetical protein